jgi:hypothetical protein
MSRSLSEFVPIPQQSDIWSAQLGGLRCTALRLRDGSLCLYSPVPGLGDAARDSLAAFGRVAFLLAPNHYHNKGLAEYTAAFPDAALVCSPRARPRLEKQTGLPFEGVNLLENLLPNDCRIVEPDGLKTGEVWLLKDTTWVVCDAFAGPSGKSGSIETRIEFLGTFPTYGIKDKEAFARWVKEELSVRPPTLVVPCHGSTIQSETLTKDINSLLG